MKNRFKQVERMLFLSTSFTIILLAIRMYLSLQQMYLFLLWNIFLAVVPLVMSRMLATQPAFNFKAICLLACWLCFFPNAPYLVTDIFHFTERPPIPKWFDLLVVVSAAWNGLMIGIVSLLQVEEFLSKHLRTIAVQFIVSASLIASAFGVYLGRFLRFNSWDVVSNPTVLMTELCTRLVNPQDHLRTWRFTFLFGLFLLVIHHTLRKLSQIQSTKP